ncbi:MAG: hypothetical protein AABX77_01155 [Nanoarchaeota archaeon]
MTKLIKISITLSNKWLYSIVAVFAILLLGVGIWAYNSNAAPNIFGHSGEEIRITYTDNGALDGFLGEDGVEEISRELNQSIDILKLISPPTAPLNTRTEDSVEETRLKNATWNCIKRNNENYVANTWMACPNRYYVAAITDDDFGAIDVFCCPIELDK